MRLRVHVVGGTKLRVAVDYWGATRVGELAEKPSMSYEGLGLKETWEELGSLARLRR